MFLPLAHMTVEHQYNGADWDDITGSVVSIAAVLREFTGAHTATLTLYDDTIDPAQGTGTHVLKEGDKLRMFADNAAGTSRKMATFTIRRVVTDIDLTKPAGRTHRITVTLKGTGITGVGGIGAASGTDDYTELSNVITGAAFEIDGDGFGSGLTAPSGTLTEAAVIDEASELDQILLTRDSNPGVYAFEDPEGAIQIFDSATARTGAATWSIGPDNYSDISMRGVDTSHVINVLTIRFVEKIKTGSGKTRKVELEQIFTDGASVAKYGPHKKTVTVHKKADFDSDYAAKVFAANADPDPVPTSVTIPVRRASELLPGYADGAYVAGKVTVTAPDGVTTYGCRVARISHDITQRRWLVKVDLRNASVIQRPRTKGSAVDTEIGNNPDGTILTDHLDDLAVTGDKLADDIDAAGKTITGASVKTNADGTARIVVEEDTGIGMVKLFTGDGDEINPALLYNQDNGSGIYQLAINSGASGAAGDAASITLENRASGPLGYIGMFAQTVETDHDLHVDDDLTVDGDASVGGSMLITDGLELHGLGGHTITGAVSSNSRIGTTAELHGADVFVDSVPTTTSPANTFMGASGRLQKSTSLSKHKIKQRALKLADVLGLLDVTPKTWIDRRDWLDRGRKYGGLRRIPGLIAEDVEHHAPAFATYSETGELEGVANDRIAAGLLLIVRSQRDEISELRDRITALEEGTS